jgi:hypothetical protein
MQDCEYHHAPGLDTIEDSIREARDKCAAHLAVNTRKHFRIALDCFEGRIDGGKEVFAEALGLRFVVPEPASQIPPNLRTVNDWKSH